MNDFVHARTWRALSAEDDGSIHAMGNGRMLVYGQGPHLIHVWGPPYTSTDLVSLRVSGPPTLESVSSRERKGPIWHHRLLDGGTDVGEMTDGVDCQLPCLIRRIHTRVPLRFNLHLTDTLPLENVPPSTRYAGRLSLLSVHPIGSPEYPRRFYSVAPNAVQVVFSGKATLEGDPTADGVWTVVCAPGESEILIAGGPEYPECLEHTEAALSLGSEALFARTRQHWAAFLAEVNLPAPTGPLGASIALAAEDTALIIASQQSEQGAVVAGHRFCLAYVRDQYGVSRALLALGLHRRARAILDFYWRIFQREGIVHNAQSIGPHTRFHVHENDDVEMTGWLMIQAFDYLEATGDDAFIREISPMLMWCAEAQGQHIVKGMLPFNGDETYVAGSILPRSALDDGSAEATLLYMAGVRRFNAWCSRHGYGNPEVLAQRCGLVDDVARQYRENFFDGPRLRVNNPRRATLAKRPRFRHGVCQGASSPLCKFLDWLELAPDGRYACPVCFPLLKTVSSESKRIFIPSVATTPDFIGFPVANPDEQAAMLDAAMAPFTDSAGGIRLPGTNFCGYELGFLLYALAEHHDPRCPAVAARLLEMRDPTGSWVEYYIGNKGISTRCRPWESAINLCGLLKATANGTLG